ncbi:hypothetical protein IX321_002457 [Bacteroides pyogenes]|nr:hypothetical protein [Bacteroides pyogenes]MBR8718517.1 hypothetical protein [Bacteroides pyogenes]MBR8758284.1 hypothetical protein [Bacteroides pyogenes]MBR8781493.1 hypothetical protein [Bacteroides pyogenes]
MKSFHNCFQVIYLITFLKSQIFLNILFRPMYIQKYCLFEFQIL